ncbi:MAG: hypothetical protein O6939_09095 [Bacteroidetes bacterium]|nr:hypothetical protein [Bacteroidota bacterium]
MTSTWFTFAGLRESNFEAMESIKTLIGQSLCMVLIWVCCSHMVLGQETEATPTPPPEPEEFVPQNLDQSFQYLKQHSETYQIYKVIKEEQLNAFWKTVMDSTQLTKNKLTEARQQLAGKEEELQNLQKASEENQQQLEQANHESTRISVLGVDVLKSNYVIGMWGLVAGLVALLVIIIAKFKNNNYTTTRVKNDFRELSEEYGDFKTRTREKEIKLKRELQTEVNTVEDLKKKLPLHRA